MIVRALSIAVLLATGVASAPADAQRRQRYVEVFGDDPDPVAKGDEIIIIGRKPESDRYRIPTELREPAAADAVSQEARVDEMVALGRTGTDSCSPVGPGGFTGCFQQQVRANKDERRAVRRAREEEPQ